MADNIKLVVTQEKFDEVFSIDDWFNFDKLSQKEVYEKLLLFVSNEEGNALSVDDARALFKKIPKAEWSNIVIEFVEAVTNAFVNPMSGGS
jgi:hypothetical protein